MENLEQGIPNMEDIGSLGAGLGDIPNFQDPAFGDLNVGGVDTMSTPPTPPTPVASVPTPPAPPFGEATVAQGAVPPVNAGAGVIPIGDLQVQGRKIINELGVDEMELRAQRGRQSKWLKTLCDKPVIELEDGSFTKATTTAVGFIIQDHEGTVHIMSKAHLLAHMYKYTKLEIGDPMDASHPYTLKIQRKIVKNTDINSSDQTKKCPITFGIITASKDYNLTHWDKNKEKFDCVEFIKEPVTDADGRYVRLPKDKNTTLDYNNVEHLVKNSKLQWQTKQKFLKEFPNRQRKNNKQAKDKQTFELFLAYGMMKNYGTDEAVEY